MQKKYALFLKVLGKFEKEGILGETILVGSWCMHFYKELFKGPDYHPTIRTRDIDFLVPLPVRRKKKTDIAVLLERDGFVATFNQEGYMRLEHPELIIEFLVPERGKGSDKPYPLPAFGVNAQSLRFLDYLANNSMYIISGGLKVRIPEPASFGLHKLIVSSRRKTEEKRLKEKQEAMQVLKAMIAEGMQDAIIRKFNDLLPSWRKKVIAALDPEDDRDILTILP